MGYAVCSDRGGGEVGYADSASVDCCNDLEDSCEERYIRYILMPSLTAVDSLSLSGLPRCLLPVCVLLVPGDAMNLSRVR